MLQWFKVDLYVRSLSYKLYCQKQNEWMKNFSHVYRFVEDDLKMAILYLQDGDLYYNDKRTINRESLMIDPSPLKSTFKSCFEMVYDSKSFKFLSREYSFLMKNGQTGYMDYALFKKDKSWMAIEENGISYHHPFLIKKKNIS